MDYTTGTTSSMNNMRPIFGAYAFQGESQVMADRHERIRKMRKRPDMVNYNVPRYQ